MGCARDARTLVTAYANGNFRVELRYSPACNARWARTTYLNSLGHYDQLPLEFGVWAQLGSGNVTRVMRFAPVVWSRMWTGPIRACGGRPGGEDNPFIGPTWACTRAR
jgi:hypothetical protein